MNEDQKICMRCKHCLVTIDDMGYGYTYARYYCRLSNALNGSVCTDFTQKKAHINEQKKENTKM